MWIWCIIIIYRPLNESEPMTSDNNEPTTGDDNEDLFDDGMEIEED